LLPPHLEPVRLSHSLRAVQSFLFHHKIHVVNQELEIHVVVLQKAVAEEVVQFEFEGEFGDFAVEPVPHKPLIRTEILD